jgi:hypothetical protein
MDIGMSTYPDKEARRFLKASMDVPLSTCEVRDCSVIYLYNTNTSTHFLYHSLYDIEENALKNIV